MLNTTTNEELQQLQGLNRGLEVVIALLLRSISRESKGLPLKEQITILDALGVRPILIAKFVGKKSGYINKELALIRWAAKKE